MAKPPPQKKARLNAKGTAFKVSASKRAAATHPSNLKSQPNQVGKTKPDPSTRHTPSGKSTPLKPALKKSPSVDHHTSKSNAPRSLKEIVRERVKVERSNPEHRLRRAKPKTDPMDEGDESSSDDSPKPKRKAVAEKFVIADAIALKPQPLPLVPTTSFKVVVGTYERLLYGLEGTFSSSPVVPTNPDDTVVPTSPATSIPTTTLTDSSDPSSTSPKLPTAPQTTTTNPSPSSRPTVTLKPIFIFPAHVGCVKAVAASPDGGKWLATGSTADENVNIWDLWRKKEVGALMQHQGSITSLQFPSPDHLLTTSEDGTICLFRASDWVRLRTFKGHIGRVNSVAVHPSGKVALSVGKDRMVRMWDFMRGKPAASTKIYKGPSVLPRLSGRYGLMLGVVLVIIEGEVVRWSNSGKYFAIHAVNTIDIYSTNMTLLHQITHSSRVQDILFVSRPSSDSEVLLVAAENKKIAAYEEVKKLSSSKSKSDDVESSEEDDDSDSEDDDGAGSVSNEPDSAQEGKRRRKGPRAPSATDTEYRLVAEFVGHASRVKALSTLSVVLPTLSTPTRTTFLSSISSGGLVHLHDLADLPPPPALTQPTTDNAITEVRSIEPVASYDTKGSRLISLTMAYGEVVARPSVTSSKKRKTIEVEDESEKESSGSEEESERGEGSNEDEDEIEYEDEDEEGEEDAWGGVS
ncbi:hypothetical protein FRB99_007393 [Tulasnella sp. 403]|nr:hypothetical protein FRB99_007393 [Tulasnella sp. 403]